MKLQKLAETVQKPWTYTPTTYVGRCVNLRSNRKGLLERCNNQVAQSTGYEDVESNANKSYYCVHCATNILEKQDASTQEMLCAA